MIEVGAVAARKEGREAALAAAARGGVTIARCICHCIRWECGEIFEE